jgi:hydroxypyruvate reductase 2
MKISIQASGIRVGVVGLGRIGAATAKRVEAFGCTVSYHNRSSKPNVPYRYYSNVHDMAADSDVFIISCPLTDETRGMIDRDALDALGASGSLVNVGRGPIVNQEELVKAVVDCRIAGAGLDVYDNEPLMFPWSWWHRTMLF